MLHLPAQDGPAAGEDPVRPLAEEGDAVVGIHEGDVHGEAGEDADELLDAEGPAGEGHRRGVGQADGILRQGGHGRRVARGGFHQAPAVARGVAPDLAPLLFREEAQAHGQEDGLLLVDHGLQRGQGRAQHRGHEELQLGAAEALLAQHLDGPLEQLAHLVVFGPHDLGGPGVAVTLQDREHQVLLALVVLVHIHEGVEGAQHGQALVGRVGLVRHGFQDGHGLPGGGDGRLQCPVLPTEGVHGMPCGQLPRFGLGHGVLEHLRVEVAHGLHLLGAHAVGHERLLHGGDLAGVHLAHQLGQAPLHLLGGLAPVQVQDDLLEGGDPVLTVVEEFAHGVFRGVPSPGT